MLPVNMPKGYSAVHSSSSPITASSSLSSSSYYTSQQIPPSANQQQQAYRHKYRSRSKSFNWFKLKFSQMDMELALWQMLYLCISPRRVYRNIYYQKQTKNQWARDDPAFVVLLLIFLGIAALAYGIALRSVFGIPHLILKMVVVDFLIVGALVATGTWAFCNKFLLSHSTYAVEQRVEWAYAWDVHCNSFFPLFLLTYILQVSLYSDLKCLRARVLILIVTKLIFS